MLCHLGTANATDRRPIDQAGEIVYFVSQEEPHRHDLTPHDAARSKDGIVRTASRGPSSIRARGSSRARY